MYVRMCMCAWTSVGTCRNKSFGAGKNLNLLARGHEGAENKNIATNSFNVLILGLCYIIKVILPIFM